jgi:hypothetical protein
MILTAGLFLPLIVSFVLAKSVYPFTSWTVMMTGGSLERPWTYYIARGETVSGDLVDLRPAQLVNALYGRTWSLAGATVNNEAFKIRNPHPSNRELLTTGVRAEDLPRGIRMPELLRVWGQLYNSKQPPSSTSRLKAVRVDVYRWDSGRFGDYATFVETWRQEL